jgi:hypothetical protein
MRLTALLAVCILGGCVAPVQVRYVPPNVPGYAPAYPDLNATLYDSGDRPH